MVGLFHCAWLIWVTGKKIGQIEQERFIESEKEVIIRWNSLNYLRKWFHHPKHCRQKIILIKQTRFINFQTFKITLFKKTLKLIKKAFRSHITNSIRQKEVPNGWVFIKWQRCGIIISYVTYISEDNQTKFKRWWTRSCLGIRFWIIDGVIVIKDYFTSEDKIFINYRISKSIIGIVGIKDVTTI